MADLSETPPSLVGRTVHYVRNDLFPFLKLTFDTWQTADSMLLGASMAYYVLFSFFPLLLIILSVIAVVVGATDSLVQQTLSGIADRNVGEVLGTEDNIRTQLLLLMSQSVSPEAAEFISNVLDNLYRSSQQASLIGFGLLLFSASGAFSVLDRVVDIIWEYNPYQQPARGLGKQVLWMAFRKLISFLLVLLLAAAIIISMLMSTIIRTITTVLRSLSDDVLNQFSDWLGQFGIDATLVLSLQEGNWLEQSLISLSTVLIVGAVLCVVFKILPSVRVAWGDVWLGALLTAFALAILNSLSGIIIGSNANLQNYGALGSVMAFMTWIFLINAVLFMGVAFTRAYALTYGSHRPQIGASDAPAAVAEG